ncbi:MAG: hypothetical protein QXL10_01015 [Candidatus Bathyarchaeia archaeon]
MKAFELRAMFERVLRKLDVIDAKVSALPQVQVFLHVRTLATVMALIRLGGSASASEVAAVTGRHRATESAVLNELVRCGVAVKEKRGRAKVFRLVEEFAAG